MIEFNAVTLRRGNQILLDKASFRIRSGEKVVLTGPSGCGKSTVLAALMGMFAPTEGVILFDGAPLTPDSVWGIRSEIALVGQEPILGAETVREALLLPFEYKSRRHKRPHEDALIESLVRTGLPPEILDKRAVVLSGGEKQRAVVARALMLGNRVFLCDEATSALDPVSKASVMRILFTPENTILSVSHDPEWIEQCSRVLRIQNRRVVEINGTEKGKLTR
jgi:putative ABC transport system ATP-binding protein